MAKAALKNVKLPEYQHDFDFEFIGLVGFEDPIRPEVPQAIEGCHNAGIRVIMITGDHPETAASIARQVNLSNPNSILTGEELSKLSEDDLLERVRHVSVCARMVPEQKLRLISALKSCGEIVAMTGDGVNDAPALKSAHVGIAMGKRGTDVARESADIVLLDDDFGSIVSAVRAGRKVYDNLQGAMVYLLAVHIPIAGMSLIPAFFNLPMVLMPVHVAFLHLIIEPTCSLVFEAGSEAEDLMGRPPRMVGQRFFSRKLFISAVWRGASILTVLIAIFLVALDRGRGASDARTLVFTTLMIANVGLILTRAAWQANKLLWWTVGFSAVLLICVLSVPWLRDLFRFSSLGLIDVVICFVAGVASSANWRKFRRAS